MGVLAVVIGLVIRIGLPLAILLLIGTIVRRQGQDHRQDRYGHV